MLQGSVLAGFALLLAPQGLCCCSSMFGAALPVKGHTVSAGLLQQHRTAERKAQIRADLEKQRETLDKQIRSIRARPHAVLFNLTDEIAMGMARRLAQDEERVHLAEELIKVVKEKKAAKLKSSKLGE